MAARILGLLLSTAAATLLCGCVATVDAAPIATIDTTQQAPPPATTSAPPAVGSATWGQTVVMSGGEKIRIAAPVAVKLSKFGRDYYKNPARVLRFDVIVTNDSGAPLDAGQVDAKIQVNEQAVTAIVDSDAGIPGHPYVTVLPGKSLTIPYGVIVSAQPVDIQIEVDTRYIGSQPAIFTGKV